MSTAAGTVPRGVKPGARSHLLNYGWPGNVRELEHAIHRAVVLARATGAGDEVVLEAQHFALQDEAPVTPPAEVVAEIPQHHNLREATESFQREMIRRALAQNNHSWAASKCAGAGNRRRQPAPAGEASGLKD